MSDHFLNKITMAASQKKHRNRNHHQITPTVSETSRNHAKTDAKMQRDGVIMPSQGQQFAFQHLNRPEKKHAARSRVWYNDIYIYDIMANLPTNIYHPCAKTHHPKKGSAPLENHPRWGFSRKSGHWKLGIEILENLGWNHLRKFRPEGPGMRTGWALILWGLKSWNTSWFSEQNLGIKQQPSKLMI